MNAYECECKQMHSHICHDPVHMLGWHELYIATQRCAGARSNKIMDPEVPHALRLQGILVGERAA